MLCFMWILDLQLAVEIAVRLISQIILSCALKEINFSDNQTKDWL